MKQIIYVSDASLPAGDDPTFVAQNIVIQSMQNNRLVDVTGFLVTDGVRFLQALEGPDLEVDRTFKRIAGDPRHRNLVVISEVQPLRRLFKDWSMATTPGAVALPSLLSREIAVQVLLDAAGAEQPQ